jgi:glycerate-2-kinase
VADVRAGDRTVVLLSGGATSLVASPVTGIVGGDLVRLFELLHASGLDIHTMNVVRKRFTRWGAGRLAVTLPSGRTDVLLISDVPGDAPADVASGPCEPDASTADEVMALLRECGLLNALPRSLRAYLDAVRRGEADETPKASHPAFVGVTTRIIGSNRLALAAVAERAHRLSLPTDVVARPLEGEAADGGAMIAGDLLARAESGWRGCVVWGGETTVRRADVSGAVARGVGGRCQELALAAAQRFHAQGGAARRVSLLAAGTDGRDGPTDAAGAFADVSTWSAILRAGLDPVRALAVHDSHAALDTANALLRRGPTGTNVMDVVIGVVE